MQFDLGESIDPSNEFSLLVDKEVGWIVRKVDSSPICKHKIPIKEIDAWLQDNKDITNEELCPECAVGFSTNIETETLENENYRKVLFTSKNMQLVVMSLNPKQEIGEEEHAGNSQFIRVESGKGKAKIGKNEIDLFDGMVVVIPQGTRHNIINTSSNEKMKIYTVYCPPVHSKGTLQKEKN